MKPSIDFPVATGLKTEQDALNNFNRLHNADDRTFIRWIKQSTALMFVAAMIFSGAMSTFLIAMDAPLWVVFCFVLGHIGVLLFMYAAVWDKKNEKGRIVNSAK